MRMSDHHPVYGIFKLKPWQTDKEKVVSLYNEIKGKVQAALWSCQVLLKNRSNSLSNLSLKSDGKLFEKNNNYLNFDIVHFNHKKTLSIELRNDGTLPDLFCIKETPPWLKVDPSYGVVQKGQTIELDISIEINDKSQETCPLIYPDLFTVIEIHFPSDQKPFSVIPIIAKYELSPLGMPFSFLSRLGALKLSEFPVSLLVPTIPGIVNSAPLVLRGSKPIVLQDNINEQNNQNNAIQIETEDGPLSNIKIMVQNKIPSELWMLVDEILTIGGDEGLFQKQGKSEEVFEIFENLRNKIMLNKRFDQHSVADALITFMSCFTEPVVPRIALTLDFSKEPSPLFPFLQTLQEENRYILGYIIEFLVFESQNLKGDIHLYCQRFAPALFGASIKSPTEDFNAATNFLMILCSTPNLDLLK